MQNNDKPCRHEYIKIFQRRFKERDRRLTSTRGYLPTGFSNKDFSYLGSGTSCFCAVCRVRLFPVRSESRAAKLEQLKKAAEEIAITDSANQSQIESEENLWLDDNTSANADSSHVVAVDELQIESADITDIVEKELNATKEEEEAEEEVDNE